MLRNRVLLAVSFAVFAAYVGTDMVVPVRVLYAQQQGASLAVIGAMATAFLISNFIFQYPAGWLADRWGRKPLMVAGLVAQAAISLAYIFAPDPLAFVVLRLLEGMASATMLPSARALIADAVPAEKRGEAYGVFNAFFNASLLLGPGIGSGLAVFGYAPVFAAAAIARLIAVGVVVALIQGVSRRKTGEQEHKRQVAARELFSLPLVGAYVFVFGDYLYLGFDLTIFPLWMQNHLGASIQLIGLTYILWGVPTTLLSPLGGRLADRVRRSTLMLVFGAAQVPFYFVFGLLESAWPVAVLSLFFGAIYALMQPAIDTHVAASSAEDVRGRVQGVYSSIVLAGAFVGANGLTWLYEVDFRLPLFGLGIAFGICVLVGGLLVRLSESRGAAARKVEHSSLAR
jgi:MFS family permease